MTIDSTHSPLLVSSSQCVGAVVEVLKERLYFASCNNPTPRVFAPHSVTIFTYPEAHYER